MMDTANRSPLHILLIDDDEDEFILAKAMLSEAREEGFILDWQPDGARGVEALFRNRYDALMVDYSLGAENGVEVIRRARQGGYASPIIMVTGAGDGGVDREAMQAGANDYLDRSILTPALLERTLRYTIRNFQIAQAARIQVETERAKLDLLIERAPSAIFMTDAQGNFTVVNPEAGKIFPPTGITGDARGPASGYTIHHWDGSLYASDELPIVRALQGEFIENEEMIIRHDDGTEIYSLVNSAPVYQDGLLTGTVTVMRDVTDFMKARHALRESQERELARLAEIQAFMDAVPAAVWIARDPQGVNIEANAYGYKILRMQPGDVISKSAGDDQAPGHFQVLKDGRELLPEDMPVQAAARGEPVADYEYDIVFADGETLHMLGNATTIWKDGKPAGSVSAFINVTERKKFEKALRESEERLRTALRSMKGFVWEHDLVRGAIYRSEGFQDVTGFTLEEIGCQDCDWTARIHPDDIPADISAARMQRDYPHGFMHEHRFLHKDGHWVWLQEQGSVLCDASGTPNRIVGATIDVTSRKNVELALRESEERFHNVLDNTPTVMFTMDADLRYTWVYNPRNDFTVDAVLGKTDYDLLEPEDAGIITAPKREVLQTGKPVRCELQYHISGNLVAYQVAFEPIFAEDGSVSGLSGLAMDIADIFNLRQQQTKDQAHIEIQRRIIEQREQERLQIARDLHDGPLQTFTAAGFLLQSLLDDTAHMPELHQALRNLKQDLQTWVVELRAYASELRPPTLASFGLEKAINAHLENFRRRHPHILVTYRARQHGPILPETPRMALYRIYQELMNNIVKHAQASQVNIIFTKTLQAAELIVQDNGVGFTVPSDWLELARRKHLGLVGLQERAEAVGGTVEITSAPGEGATVRIVIPLPEA